MRTPRLLRGLAVPVVSVVLGLVVTGCAAGPVPATSASSAAVSPAPTPTVSTPTVSAPAVSTPTDGLSLAALGFENGPADRVFVPYGAQVSSRVDQTDNVTLVLTSPSAAELAAFYLQTATDNGFTITADDPSATTLTFAGFGWTGTFTGDSRASALLLRPAR